MPNFAKSAAIVNVKPIAGMNTMLNPQSVPKEVISSMEMQGLTQNSPYSPGMPINPVNTVGTQPRQYEYRIGQNIVQRPRSTENISFDTMRSIIEMYDVAQMCIEVRQDELRNLDWDIVPMDEDDSNASEKYSSEIKLIREFFKKPDGYTLFDDFQNQLAYDWLAYDALAIAPELTKGGKLFALHAIDGTTFTPIVDYYGRIPQAPAPAYMQWINGMPWTWLNRDQLIYRPHRKRTNKLYGFSPVEWLLTNINTDIRYQLYFLQYFTEGSIPETWMEAPQGVSDPKQIKQFQTMYDAVMIGDQSQKHKVKWIPFGSKVTQAKDTKFDIAFPQFMLNKTCAAFKVAPSELGFTEKVNKSSGETQENMQYRRSLKPSATFFQNIYTGIIHQYFGLTNLCFKFMNIGEQEDLLAQAQADEIDIRNGIISPDEARVQRRGLKVDPNNKVGRVFITGSYVVPVEEAMKGAGEDKPQEAAQVEQEKDTGQIVMPDDNNKNVNKAAMDFFVNPVGKRKSQNSQIK